MNIPPALPRFLVVMSLAGSLAHAQQESSTFKTPHNTQELTAPLLSPEQALLALRLPSGFQATVFAAEPAVRQPIAMAFDARGRLWVAENYTYAEREVNHDLSLHDRIVILEDTDQDGHFDKRSVFWDRGQRLTSIEIGFGGVWVLCAPHLLFIPDRDGDDVPDGEPEVVLEGWAADTPRHNFVNGLKWGPDGWLYGRHGITDSSMVGPPGTPEEFRTRVHCGIWRIHPVDRRVEVVCEGTTNPWGSDWDQHGELFFINTVIGHLWHALPGAHFERMFGEDFNPHLYDLIEQTADHYHWDQSEPWHQAKQELTQSSSSAGGGHAHTGMMIYLGDNWPASYRNDVYTWNFHGRRMNRDALERQGATYVAHHRNDPIISEDVWCRGVEIGYGPDGGVYVLDWSDIGECHENDGVHRTSGRIFKITSGASPQTASIDLARLDSQDLVEFQRHANEWYARQSRQLLQQRAAEGADLTVVRRQLADMFEDESDVVHQLRALWCLVATGAVDESWLIRQLHAQNEHVRVWAVRLLMDGPQVSSEAAQALAELAERESSGLVLTYLAASLQRIPAAERWQLASRLVQHGTLANDRVFPQMVWYGIESAVPEMPLQAVKLLDNCQLPLVARSMARRVTYDIARRETPVDRLVDSLERTEDSAYRVAVLQGIHAAFRGWLTAPKPMPWDRVAPKLARDKSTEVVDLARSLSALFGDGRAIEDLARIAKDADDDGTTRRQAIRTLVDTRAELAAPLLEGLLSDRDVSAAAVRGLATLAGPGTTELLLTRYDGLRREGREAVVESLASRPADAKRLLVAVSESKVDPEQIPPFLLRQMQLFGDPEIDGRLHELWPHRKLIAEDKVGQIRQYRAQLDQQALTAAHLENGRTLFEKSCANCHKLFGKGGAIGPELTGAQRTNLTYLLENIVDPSATVALNHRMSIIELASGQVLNGVVMRQSERTIELQTPTDKVVIDRRNIDTIRQSELSLMPDGLLSNFDEAQVRDLFGFLMSDGRSKLP